MENRTRTSLSEIMKTASQRKGTLESLITFLQTRMGEVNQQEALTVFQAIQNSDNRNNIGLQDFAHDLHRHSIHELNGDHSLPAPTLPEALGDIEIPVNPPDVNPEETIMYLILEWAKQVTGHTYEISDGSNTQTSQDIAPAPTPVPRIDAPRPTPVLQEINSDQALETLRSEFPDIAAFLTQEVYEHKDGRRLIPKKLLVQLVEGNDAADANIRMSQWFKDKQILIFSYMDMLAAVQDSVDQRMRFHTVADALMIVRTIVKKGHFRANYTEAHGPAKKKDNETQSHLNGLQPLPESVRQQLKVPTPTRTQSPMAPRDDRFVRDDRSEFRSADEERVLEPVRNEIATLMTTNHWLFGEHSHWVKKMLQTHTVVTADKRFFISVTAIHTEILGGFLTKLFDPTFEKKMVHSVQIGPEAAGNPGKYFCLEDAIEYIHVGHRTTDVGLKVAS